MESVDSEPQRFSKTKRLLAINTLHPGISNTNHLLSE
jgi:hypothetical protein